VLFACVVRVFACVFVYVCICEICVLVRACVRACVNEYFKKE
jgi:hypothetical protein